MSPEESHGVGGGGGGGVGGSGSSSNLAIQNSPNNYQRSRRILNGLVAFKHMKMT